MNEKQYLLMMTQSVMKRFVEMFPCCGMQFLEIEGMSMDGKPGQLLYAPPLQMVNSMPVDVLSEPEIVEQQNVEP